MPAAGAPGDEHKARVAEVFDRTAARYDRFGSPLFAPLGRRLVELARIPPGARVLDVATGTGAVLVPAAEAAASGGEVIGIDIAPEMVAAVGHMSARAPAGMARFEARVGDAEDLHEFAAGSFDAVLCACAISFFPRPERAASEFLRVLRAGGVVGVSRWSEADPRWEWYPQLLRGYGVEARKLMAGSPDPHALLAAAGFGKLTVTAEPFEIAFATPEEWWSWLWAMPYRAALESLADDARARLRAAALERVGELRGPGGIRLRAEARYVIGRKPG